MPVFRSTAVGTGVGVLRSHCLLLLLGIVVAGILISRPTSLIHRPLLGRITGYPRDLPDEPFPTDAHAPRQPLQPLPLPQFREFPHHLDVLGARLGESDPGVQDDPPPPDARFHGFLDPFVQLGGDAVDDAVRVGCQCIHGFGVAAHVHQDVCASQVRDCGEHFGVHEAAGNIVDDVGARFDAGAGDRGVVGVDAEENVIESWLGTDILDRWEDASELFLGGKGGGVWAGGLAADIEDGDLVVQEGVKLGKEGRGAEGWAVFAVVGERVGGQVQDGHEFGFAIGKIGGQNLRG